MINFEYRIRKLTIDVYDILPEAGMYLVTVKKGRKPGLVYQVCTVRKVNSKHYSNRYSLEVITRPNLINEAKITFRFAAYVGPIPAIALFPYNKKHKPKKDK